jgi:hypothetical protein
MQDWRVYLRLFGRKVTDSTASARINANSWQVRVSVDLKTQMARKRDVLLSALATARADLPQPVLVIGLADDFKVEVVIAANTAACRVGI